METLPYETSGEEANGVFVGLRTFAAGTALVLSAFGARTPAVAQTFSPPQALSVHGYGNALQLAVDRQGDSLATWADAGGWYGVRPAGGTWSAPASLYAGGGLWFLQTTANGSATIVSYTSLYGIWSVDRPPGGAWSAPALVVNAPQIITGSYSNPPQFHFLQDVRGDQAIVYETYVAGGTAIVAVRRPAGGTWGPLETVASSATFGDISLEAAAIGGGGDVVAAFETFQVVCAVRTCHDIDYVLHAAREAAGTAGWTDSGPLTAPSTEDNVQAVVDASGRAELFVEGYLSGTVLATKQVRAGASWRPFTTAYANPAVNLVQTYGTAAVAGNRWTLGFDSYGTNGLLPTLLEGSLVANAAPLATVFGTNDPVAPTAGMQFAENPNGAAVIAWADGDGSVRVSTRRISGGPWSAPQTIIGGSGCNIGGVICTAPVSAAIDAAGHAAVGFRRYDPSVTVSTVYVSND